MRQLQAETGRAGFVEKAASIAKQRGYNLSPAEIESYLDQQEQQGELSPDALKSVAGGAGQANLGKYTYSRPGCT